MIGIILISLLSIGAVAGLLFELDDDDNNNSSTPTTPGVDPEPPTEGDPTVGDMLGNMIEGGEGDDDIEGRGGDDRLFGGAGDDKISGEEDNDDISGEAGDDSLFGGTGDDEIYASDGSDLAFGGDGDDLIFGGSGNDLLSGGLGADTLNGSTGDDVLVGTETDIGNMTADEFDAEIADAGGASGAAAVLSLLDLPGSGEDNDAGDVLNAGFGDDALIIGSDDTATGGGGDDIFNIADWIQAGHAATITDYNGEDDQIVYSFDSASETPEITVTDDGNGNAVVDADGVTVAVVNGAAGTLAAEDIQLVAQSDNPEAGIRLTGTPGDDDLVGTDNEDLISSLAGDDSVLAGASTDIIHTKEGNDVVDAGAGDDRTFGNDGDDALFGQSGNDFIRGGAGEDLIVDTDGNDTIRGDNDDDIIISSGFVDEDALHAAILTNTPFDPAAVDLSTDTDGADDIHAGSGDDLIMFGIGDSVTGGPGDDTFMTSDAVLGNEASLITDFNLSDDVLVYSTAAGSTPTVTVSYSAGATATEGDATVLVDGEALTVVQGVGTDFSAANVQITTRTA